MEEIVREQCGKAKTYRLNDVSEIPTSPGIYAIINTATHKRYVGQAKNVQGRIQEHIRDLDLGRERTNAEMRLQKAWTEYGRDALVVTVLEFIDDNSALTHYSVRPDNLALAEHHYINERAEYNVDSRIVSGKFADLVARKAWRVPLTAEEKLRIVTARRSYPYLVAKRGFTASSIIVEAYGEMDAKELARQRSPELQACGKNLSTLRLTPGQVNEHLKAGVPDRRKP